MELEKQVVSLELAKKLKESGVRQESYFHHIRISDTPDGRQDWLLRNSKWGEGAMEEYSAFTVAELGEMLPAFINLVDRNYQIEMWSGVGMDKQRFWSIGYNDHGNRTEFVFGALTEANARAAMLVYLLENNLISCQHDNIQNRTDRMNLTCLYCTKAVPITKARYSKTPKYCTSACGNRYRAGIKTPRKVYPIPNCKK